MKNLRSELMVVLALLVGNAQAQAPAADTNAEARIQFQTTSFDFGKLSSGQAARHDFIFTNTGNAVLEITSVRPSCGCTTAGDWSKNVEPGKTGTIPLQFNSAGFSGMVVKTATVTCNDKAAPNHTLQLSGNVWKEVDVVPQYAVMNGSSESVEGAKATIKIVNNGELPIGITSIDINNGMFVADLKTNQPGKEFELFVKVVPPVTPNMNHGIITLRTTSTNVPQVQVTCMLMVQPVIVVSPPQFSLPPPPMNNAFAQTVSVRNSGTNMVKLSDPTVSDNRISATVKEIEPGRGFNVEVNVPQGFLATQGQTLEVALKTTHPQYPELKIPVFQPGVPPAATAVPAVVPAAVPAPASAAHAH